MTLVYEQLLAPTKAKQLANRLPALLDAAAGQFAQHGYHGATIRDVAKAVAMTPGAIYFHFPSKQHLLIAVYEEGVRRILDKLETATAGDAEPWARLERAVLSHLESILEESPYARVIIRVLPQDVPEVAGELKALRERYEAPFRAIIADLALPSDEDRKYLRLFLIGALNWTPVWYRPGADDLRAIAGRLLTPLRALQRQTT